MVGEMMQDDINKEEKDMMPDKYVYKTNRRRMAWLVMGMLLAMTIAIIIVPDRDGNNNVMEMAYLALSGLIAAYFGAAAYQAGKLGRNPR